MMETRQAGGWESGGPLPSGPAPDGPAPGDQSDGREVGGPWAAGQRRTVRLVVIAGLVLVGAVAAGAVTVHGGAARPSLEPMMEPKVDVEPVGLARSEPVRVRIPAIEVDAGVTPLHLDRGVLAKLPEPALVGWYERGTSPGEPGSAVLIGYLDVTRPGSAAFGRLDWLTLGDQIEVARADGSTVRFTVERITAYPATEGYRGVDEEVRLRLVGVDRANPDHRPEVVVFAALEP